MANSITTPESVRHKWFRTKGRAARAYYYVSWAYTFINLVSFLSDYDEEMCPELVGARKALDDLLAETREEIIKKYSDSGTDELVINELLRIFEFGYEKDDDENGPESEEYANELYNGLFETNLIDKAEIFAARLDDACESTEALIEDDNEQED